MSSIDENNVVKVVGTVATLPQFSHEVYGEEFYNFKLRIKRLSDMYDILVVTVSERLIDRKLIQVGELFEIRGQIRSYNNYTSDIRENKLVLNVFARDITLLNKDEPERHNNEVEIVGFICKAPVHRSTPFGREITDVLIAVNRHYNKSDYIPCIVWGKNAKFVSKLEVGSKLKVWGRLQSRVYQKKLENGEVIEKNAFELSISKLELFKEEKVLDANNVEANNLEADSIEVNEDYFVEEVL